MDEQTKKEILKKNENLISMVIERAKRDFPEDIAIIGLTGSFCTGDFHERSDLDLIIINNTERGWGISYGFILGEVGYDIYCTPWETRIKAASMLETPYVSHLLDLQILYCAKPEYLDKFNQYKQNALDLLAKPIGKECMGRAKKHIDEAKQEYADTMLYNDIGTVRYAAGRVLYHLVNGLVSLNNTYIKRGIKRYFEELLTYQFLPDNFEKLYMSVIESKTVEELRSSSHALLKSLVCLYERMCLEYGEKPTPTFDNLWGTYEELWCNCRGKVIASTVSNDLPYAFHAALGAQSYLDEMTMDRGTKKYDLMQYYDPENLTLLREKFLRIMDDYLSHYDKVGRKVEKFDTFEQVYNHYMNECTK